MSTAQDTASRSDPTKVPGSIKSAAIDVEHGGEMDSVSCVTASWCMAIDTGGDYAIQADGNWSLPNVADPSGGLVSVSCISSTECVAVDYHGNAVTFDGSRWSAPSFVDPFYNLTAVSCVASTTGGDTGEFCIAVDNTGRAVSFNGSSWSAPVHPYGSALDTISCAASSFCVALSPAGTAVVFDGSWQIAAPVPGITTTADVSCPTTTFCMVVGGTESVAFDGGTWLTPTEVVAQSWNLQAISCFSATSCVATDNAGNAYAYDGSSWTTTPDNVSQLPFQPSAGALSCPSGSFCEAVGGSLAEGLTDAVWESPSAVDRSGNGPSMISCPSTTFCAAIDPVGYAYVLTDGVWSAPVRLPGAEAYVDSVSCASPTMCVAVGYGGSFKWDGTSWSAQAVTLPSSTWLDDVSCVSASFCMAIDDGGDTYSFDGSSWSGPLLAPISVSAVSCTSATFCMAVGGGQATVFDGTSWDAPTPNGFDAGETPSLSCTSKSFCMAVGQVLFQYSYTGYVDSDSLWNGTAWTLDQEPPAIPPSASGNLTCASDLLCVFGDSSWDGTTWSEPVAEDGDTSCPAINLCFLAAGSLVGAFDPTGWIFGIDADPHFTLTSLSCSAAGACVAVDDFGHAFSLADGARGQLMET